MATLPTGTVTFLFTDIEGSTQRWDAHPDAMRAALERHDALMRTAVEAHAGQVFKTVGDAFCAAFATAGAGLAAAIEAQRAVAAEDWSRFGEGFSPILVRMGLHTGEASERGGDYFGPPVNRVARIEAAGNGGQLLLSRDTHRSVEAAGLPEGCRLRDLGEHQLKDLRQSERITQVVIEACPDVTRPLRTAGELDARDLPAAPSSSRTSSSPAGTAGRSRAGAGREPTTCRSGACCCQAWPGWRMRCRRACRWGAHAGAHRSRRCARAPGRGRGRGDRGCRRGAGGVGRGRGGRRADVRSPAGAGVLRGADPGAGA